MLQILHPTSIHTGPFLQVVSGTIYETTTFVLSPSFSMIRHPYLQGPRKRRPERAALPQAREHHQPLPYRSRPVLQEQRGRWVNKKKGGRIEAKVGVRQEKGGRREAGEGRKL